MKTNDFEIKTTRILNGETFAYLVSFSLSFFMLVSIKQIFKVFVQLDASVSCLIAFIAASVLSYLLERRFVFRKKVLSSNIKQVIMLVIRAAVNFGFYKLCMFGFTDLLNMPTTFSWMLAILMSFMFNYFFDRTLLFDCDYRPETVKKSRLYKAFYSNKYVVLSFVFAFVAISIIYLIFSVFPFGDNTVMRMDLYHQYGPLFAELYDRVVNHQSFLYSWTSGGGTSFLGNYFNYLSSPLTTLIFLFDKEDISFAISFIVAVKCILSATTFAYYLKKSIGKNDVYISAFGVLYAFCAYFLAYYWNVMWLDAMFVLPLLALGIENIVKSGNAKLYIASLTYILLANYYMGYMMCIFAVIYFLVFLCIAPAKYKKTINPQLQFKNKYSVKALMNNGAFNSVFKFGVSSIICGLLCAVSLIPVYFILKGCSATSGSFPTSFTSYFPLFDFITSHFAGMQETIRSSGDDVLPNVYCGVLSILLLPLFVINKKISIKEKAGYIILLILMVFFFDNNCANYIWHGLHFPNDLPYRFSFMYSFILLIIGYKTLVKFNGIDVKDISYVGLAWVFIVLVAQKLTNTKMTEYTVYVTLAFVIIWTAFLTLSKKNLLRKSLKSTMIIVFILCEIIASDSFVLKITQSNEDYKDKYDTYTEAIDYIKDSDEGFYKTELCYLDTRMDPCYYGYEGMSIFSSMAYESYSGVQKNLGMFGNLINSYTYNTQTPVYNMMFNLKYLIQTSVSLPPSNNLYQKLYTTSDGESNVYQNKFYLPIAYCVNQEIDDWVTENDNPFEIQSDFVKLSTGIDKDVFVAPEFNSTDFDEVSGDDVSENGSYWVSKNSTDSTYGNCDITLTAKTSGNFFIYVSSNDIKNIEVNSDKVASHVQSIEEPYILDVGYHDAGDEIVVSIDAGSMEDVSESYYNFYAYSLDEAVFNEAYQKLNTCSMDVTSHSDTIIEGTINCKEDSYIYSSIPYDDGWKIYIDGEEAETFEVGTAMLATTIKPGEHEIVFKYSPKGIIIGSLISAVTVFGLGAYTVLSKKVNKSTRRKNEEIVD